MVVVTDKRGKVIEKQNRKQQGTKTRDGGCDDTVRPGNPIPPIHPYYVLVSVVTEIGLLWSIAVMHLAPSRSEEKPRA